MKTVIPIAVGGVGLISVALVSLHLWALLVVLMGVSGVTIASYGIRNQRALAARHRKELLDHIAQQQKWLAEGDPRGIYGTPPE